jgi:hypothetical protein
MKTWTDQIQKGDVIEYNGHRRKVRAVKRKDESVQSVVVAKRKASQFDSPTTRISANRLRSDSYFGIVDTNADLEETYLEENIQRLVESKSPRPPTQSDLSSTEKLY